MSGLSWKSQIVPIYICSYYRPNVNDNESNIALTTSLERLPRNCSTNIAGDFNYPGIKWPEATIQANTPYYNLHADFIDTLHDHGLEQVVYHKTREDNTLDLLITNNPSSCRNVIVKPGISDHDVVLASLDVNIPRINQVRRKIPLFNKADWCRFHGHMISIHNSIQDMAMTCSMDDLWSTFKQGIITGIEKYIPHTFAKERNGKPWVKKPLQRLIAKRNRHYIKYRATGSRYHKDKYKQTKAQVQ